MAVVYARVAPKRDTTSNWIKHPGFVPFRGEIIIYTDYKTYTDDVGNAHPVAGIKIGDGKTVVGELPFVNSVSGGAIEWEDIRDTPYTLAGYGIEDAATKDELEEVASEVRRMFRFCGSVLTYYDLANIINPDVGDVYYVDSEGSNYAWDGSEWDSIGSTVDMSQYWAKAQLVPVTNSDIDIITGVATSVETFLQILENSNSVTLMADLEFEEQIIIDKQFTIDLGGCVINYSYDDALFSVDGGNLTIKGNGMVNATQQIAEVINGGAITISNGDMITDNIAITVDGNDSSATFSGGTIYTENGGIIASNGAVVEVSGGSIECRNGPAIYTDSAENGYNTVVINGGEITGSITSAGYEACGVLIANNDSFVMNGGTVCGDGGAGIVIRGGTAEINGGAVIAQASENRPEGSTGWIKDTNKEMTQTAVIYDEESHYPGSESMSLTINDGRFTGIAHSLEVLSDEVEPAVFVYGGEFTPEYEGGNS